MTIRKPYIWKGLVDMSWNKYNLYNLYNYSRKGPERDINRTAFQLAWRAKQLAIPYHAAQINQKTFRKLVPKHMPASPKPKTGQNTLITKSNTGLSSSSSSSSLPTPPSTMLMFSFMERRVDTILFRACFCTSIWEARYLVNTRSVTVNGKLVKIGGYMCEDGDIIQITRPDRVPLLNGQHRGLDENWEVDLKPSADSSEQESASETNENTPSTTSPDHHLNSSTRRKPSDPMSNQDYGMKPAPYMSPWMFVPEYLEVNFNNLSVCLLRSPQIKPGRCEIPSPYDEIIHQRAFDLYVRYRVPF